MRFLHTRVRVRDMERSVAFYEMLGMRQRGTLTSPRGNQLVFMQDPETSAEIELCFQPGSPDFSLDEDIFHMAFGVKDMDEAIGDLTRKGVKVTEEPAKTRSGSVIAFIEDPDGYEIELVQRP